MAHYAKLGLDNIVTAIVAIDTITCMTRDGVEKEEIGLQHLIKHHGHDLWKKCSYNTRSGEHINGGTPFRANYPGIGWYYNSQYDIFHPPKPEGKDSWTLNTTTGRWDPPISEPELTIDDPILIATTHYHWDEDLYQSDNTKGWILLEPS